MCPAALRPDRTIISVRDFIRGLEHVEAGGLRLSAMGPEFVEPVSDHVDTVLNDLSPTIPAVYLLSAGADPTENIEAVCRKKKQSLACVSMGEGQEPVASNAITAAA